jgi:hypothetical protein
MSRALDIGVTSMKRSPPRRKRSISMLDRTRPKNKLPFGETRECRTRIAIQESESYIVPMIARAIDISELLQGFDSGLRVKGIKQLTGYSESTVYRILRTLVAFGYVLRDSSGAYRLNRYTPQTGTNSTDEETKDGHLCIAD